MRASLSQLQGSIAQVRYARVGEAADATSRAIDFFVDGTPWRGYLRGGNRTLRLGTRPAENASVAMRLLLDPMAHPLAGHPQQEVE